MKRLLLTACIATGLIFAAGGVSPAVAAFDNTPPSVNMSPSKVVLASTLSNNTATPTVQLTLSWTQYDASGICGEYGELYNSATRTWTYQALTLGQTSWTFADSLANYYYFQVVETDCASPANTSTTYNYSAYMSIVQSGSAALSAGWTSGSCNCWSFGSTEEAKKAGASISYTFSGASIAIIGDQAPGRGVANVFLDGVNVSHYNGNAAKKNLLVVYSHTFPTYGSHTIKIVTATAARVDVDALLIG